VNAELWASSSTLFAASPYFKTMLDSGVGIENVQRRGHKRLRSGAASRGTTVSQDGTLARESSGAAASEIKEDSEGTGLDDSDDDSDDILASNGSLVHEDTADDGDFTYTVRSPSLRPPT
jgi:hypothetical protein